MYDKNIVNRAVIHYLHFNRSLRKVARVYGCGYTTLGGWVRKNLGSSAPPPRKRKSPVSDAIRDAVAQCVADDPFTTLADIVRRIQTNFPTATEGTRAGGSCSYVRLHAHTTGPADATDQHHTDAGPHGYSALLITTPDTKYAITGQPRGPL